MSERLGDGCGRASAGRRRRLRSEELKGESQGRGEDAAGEGKERGDTGHRRGVARRGRGSRRWPGKQEVAGAASALATHLFVLLAEEEDDKGALVGWAASWAASRLQ